MCFSMCENMQMTKTMIVACTMQGWLIYTYNPPPIPQNKKNSYDREKVCIFYERLYPPHIKYSVYLYDYIYADKMLGINFLNYI